MVLPGRQRVLLVVLGLSLTGLAADRLVFGTSRIGPNQAAAAPADGVPVPLLQAQVAEKKTDRISESAPGTLVARLDCLRREQGLEPAACQDAFCPSPSWLADLQPQEPPGSDQQRAREFVQRRRLKAVLRSANGGAAIIDDQYLTVGQTLDGFQLLRVGDRSAVLVSDRAHVTLELDPQNQAN